MTAKQFADSDIRRTPYRFACQSHEMLVEKQCRTFVGEHHGSARQVGAILIYNVFRYVFKKRLHIFFTPYIP